MSRANLNIVDCIQGDAEWLRNRLGMLTASRIADALAVTKRGPSQLRENLKIELAVERITERAVEHYVSDWMERGTKMEPLARACYELRRGVEVQQVGFVLHPSIVWAGASPDGLIHDTSAGLAEFKCPKPTTHANYLIGECVPEEYRPQMLWQLACCPGYEWNDFVSYCPDFPEPLDLFVCRLHRDHARISNMEAEAARFLAEVDATVVRIRGGLAVALKQSLEARKRGQFKGELYTSLPRRITGEYESN